MPKLPSDNAKVYEIVLCYPGEFVITPHKELFCNFCNTQVKHGKQYFIETRQNTGIHRRNSSCPSNSKSQQFLTSGKTDFTKKILKAFLSADIPLWKLCNEELKKLFNSIGHGLPADETCRLQVC